MVVPWTFTVSNDAIRLNTNGLCAFCETVHFPCGSAGKESACNAGDLSSVSGWGRSPGEGKGYPLQYSGLETSMDYSSWGHKELDTTEQLSLSLHTSLKLYLKNESRQEIY